MIFFSTSFISLFLAVATPEQALDFEKKQDYVEAAKAWSDLTQENPDNPFYFYKLGRSFYLLGEYERAEIHLRHALAMDPRNPDFLVTMAYIYLREGKLQESIVLFKKVLVLVPDYTDAQEGLVQAQKALSLKELSVSNEGEIFEKIIQLEAEERYEEILAIWQELVIQEPHNYLYLYELARAYSHLERYDEAIEYFHKSLYYDPGNTDVLSSLGYAYLQSGRLNEAEEAFNKALAIAPRNKDAREGLRRLQTLRTDRNSLSMVEKAEFLEGEGDFQGALGIWEELVKRHPNDVFYNYRLGRALQALGRYEKAQAYLTYALRLDPNNAETKMALDDLYLALRDDKQAEEILAEQVSKADSTRATKPSESEKKEISLIDQAIAYEEGGEFAKAAAVWKELAIQEPENAHYFYRVGINSMKAGDESEALTALITARVLDPMNNDIAVVLGYLYLRLGQEERAEELFNEVLQDYPAYEDAKQGLAILREQEKNRKEPNLRKRQDLLEEADRLEASKESVKAAQVWKELLALDPENQTALSRLAHFYLSIGSREEAESYYRRILAIKPDDVDAKVILGYLLMAKNQYAEAKKLFIEVLQEVPTYADAETGLAKIEEAIAEEASIITPRFTIEQEEEIAAIRCYEKRSAFDKAATLWEELYEKYPNDRYYSYELGRSYSLQRKYRKALHFLEEALDSEVEGAEVRARIAANYLALGYSRAAKSLYNELVEEFPDNGDYLAGLARSFRALNCFCASKRLYEQLFDLGDLSYDLFHQYYNLSKWTDPSIYGSMLYGQERETDLITKQLAAQRNTTLGFGTFHQPLFENLRLTASIVAGTIREMNLVANDNNLFIKQQDYGLSATWLMLPEFSISSGVIYEVGKDIGTPTFPIGDRYRILPNVSFSYNVPTQSALLTMYYDTLLIKDFGAVPTKGNLLKRQTVLFSDEQLWFYRNLKVGGEFFYRFYEGDPFNRQWQGAFYGEMGFPKYLNCFSIRYWGQVGGFTTNQTVYYSYKRQWQHSVFLLFSKEAALNLQIDAALEEAAQWSRDLNQPVNTLVFVDKLFRSYTKLYFEAKHLYRPDTEFSVKTTSYWDSTRYTTWDIRGSMTYVF